MYRQYPFSEQKQRKAKVKVKETDPPCSQIWFFPVTRSERVSDSLQVTYNNNIYNNKNYSGREKNAEL